MKSPSEEPKSSSNSTNKEHLAGVVALCIILFVIAVMAFIPPPSQRDTDRLTNPLIATEQMFDDMPDSPFKSNLMIVMGAHLAGSDQQLNQLLTAYAEMIIERMEKAEQNQ